MSNVLFDIKEMLKQLDEDQLWQVANAILQLKAGKTASLTDWPRNFEDATEEHVRLMFDVMVEHGMAYKTDRLEEPPDQNLRRRELPANHQRRGGTGRGLDCRGARRAE